MVGRSDLLFYHLFHDQDRDIRNLILDLVDGLLLFADDVRFSLFTQNSSFSTGFCQNGIGLILGAVLGFLLPGASFLSLLGTLFVGALKALAPLLVFFLVLHSLAQHKKGAKSNMSTVIALYLIGTLLAALCAVVASFLFPSTLALAQEAASSAPGGIGEILQTLLNNSVSNPISAMAEANYIGVLLWAVVFGIALRDALLSQKDYGAEMFRYARQFAAAEQIVLSAPLWDLSFPAQLKIYLENIFVTGIVTRYSEAGLPVGLCRAKKLYYVSTSGGPYDSRFGFDQLRAMATENFGIPEAELVKAELLDIDGCDPEAILHKAMEDYGLTETTDKEGGHAT